MSTPVQICSSRTVRIPSPNPVAPPPTARTLDRTQPGFIDEVDCDGIRDEFHSKTAPLTTMRRQSRRCPDSLSSSSSSIFSISTPSSTVVCRRPSTVVCRRPSALANVAASFRPLSLFLFLFTSLLVDFAFPPSSSSPWSSSTSSPSSRSLLVYSMEHQYTSVPVGANVHFSCISDNPAIWIKLKDNAVFDRILASGLSPYDPSTHQEKYGFLLDRKNNLYTMVIRHVDPSDAGSYMCGNIQTYTLFITTVPICSPPNLDLYEGLPAVATCKSTTFGGLRPELSWSLGNATGLGKSVAAGPNDAGATTASEGGADDEDGADIRGEDEEEGREGEEEGRTVATIKFTPNRSDHGKTLRCGVTHQDFWNSSLSFPFCQFPRIDVKFSPTLSCEKSQFVDEDAPVFMVTCKVSANPPVPPRNVSWSVWHQPSRRRVPLSRNVIMKCSALRLHTCQVNVIIEKTLLMPSRPSLLLGVRVKGQRKEIDQNVTLTLLFKPRVTCTEEVYEISKPSGRSNITCFVYSNPVVDPSNLSWTLTGAPCGMNQSGGRAESRTSGPAPITRSVNVSTTHNPLHYSVHGWHDAVFISRFEGGVAASLAVNQLFTIWSFREPSLTQTLVFRAWDNAGHTATKFLCLDLGSAFLDPNAKTRFRFPDGTIRFPAGKKRPKGADSAFEHLLWWPGPVTLVMIILSAIILLAIVVVLVLLVLRRLGYLCKKDAVHASPGAVDEQMMWHFSYTSSPVNTMYDLVLHLS